jgi:O-acetyl-ADP-ribose deacetylase (regulator of RNase III)
MRLILVDRGKELCDVLRWEFRTHPEVEIVHGRFEDLPAFDCVITAGNSFGLMDAGIDLAVVRYFGRHVMERIQRQILDDYLGEQPVGTCILIPTDHATHPFVAHSPTMRVPMNIQGTDHVYLSLWASLTAVHRYNRTEARQIKTLACPGLGTGTGGVNALEAAIQLRLAYEHFKRPAKFINPTMAQERHERIHYGGRFGFANPRSPEL